MTHRPIWSDDRSLTREQIANLEELDSLRTERPVIWAMLMGKVTSQSIAKFLGWPRDWVLLILRGYKKDDIVLDHHTPKWGMVWNIQEDEAELWELRAWIVRELKPGGLFNPA